MSNPYQVQFQRSVNLFRNPRLLKLISPGVYKLLRRWLAREGLFGGSITAQLFFGDDMEIVLPEVISEVLYTYGFFDEEVTNMVLRAVRPGEVVLDVGAHFGYFTLLLSHMVGEGGRVLSFEPTPSTYEILERNTRGHDNVEVFNLAAGGVDTRLDISDFGLKYSAWNSFASEARMPQFGRDGFAAKVEVGVVALDTLLAARNLQPDFIKIDAENFEADVIQGLAATLRAKPVKVLMETGSDSSLRAGYFLLDLGLRPHVADIYGELSACPEDYADANMRYKDILFMP
jgi:FkbM family methyltransferase